MGTRAGVSARGAIGILIGLLALLAQTGCNRAADENVIRRQQVDRQVEEYRTELEAELKTKVNARKIELMDQMREQNRTDEDPLVAVVAPLWGNLKRLIRQPGYVRPFEQTPIYARVQGYVDEVNVDMGHIVKKGQQLARLRVPELEQEWKAKSARAEQARSQETQAAEGLKAAEANVKTMEALIEEAIAAIDKAKAESHRWELEYARTKKLFDNGTYDRQTLDEAGYQWLAAKAGLRQAEAKKAYAAAAHTESAARAKKAAADLAAATANVGVAVADRDQAKVWYDFRILQAPYDGVVTMRNVHPGQFLQVSSSGSTNKAAEPLFNFVSVDKVRVTVQVPEYDATLVRADEDLPAKKDQGSLADVAFQGLNGKVIPGRVTRKSDLLDNQARTLKVEIQLDNKDRELLPGMYVNSTIHVETAKTWMLPLSAVFTDGDKSYCFLIEPAGAGQGKAVKTVVKVGVANDRSVEVLKKRPMSGAGKEDWADFAGNENIVAGNPESLLHGQRVRFVPAK